MSPNLIPGFGVFVNHNGITPTNAVGYMLFIRIEVRQMVKLRYLVGIVQILINLFFDRHILAV
jgi:hypothetical protein